MNRKLAVVLLLLVVIPSPGTLAGTDRSASEVADAPPPWYEAGLDTMLDRLYDRETGAILETARPIDHGDRWAWVGDNGKALGAIADSDRRHERRAGQLAAFLSSMSEGPIVFQRWVDTSTSTVVARNGSSFEVSNHLITLEGDLSTGLVDAEIEYHDGRDKVFVTFGPADVLVDGRWHDLGPLQQDAGVSIADENRSVTVSTMYRFQGARIWENLTLDASPRVEHALEVLPGAAQLDGIRLDRPDATVRRPEVPYQPRAYTDIYTPTEGRQPVAETDPLVDGSRTAPTWLMYLEPARQDEFATGLSVGFHDADRLESATTTKLHPFQLDAGEPRLGAGNLRHAYTAPAQQSPTSFSVKEDLVLLDGVLTSSLASYEPLVENVTSPRYEGVDASLLYEVGDTALGLLAYAEATERHDLVDQSERWIEGYLAHHERGTQTRSLAAALLTSLRLSELQADEDWLRTAEELATVLRTYQIDDANADAEGAVRNQPGGGPFFDSTVAAARAWHELATATGNDTYRRWADATWSSFSTRGERIRMGGGDTNHWTYKDGLLLQVARHVPDELRWAARNHLWTALRDVDDYAIHTSRFANATNSETQAWALEGLLTDRQSWEGPWILDSETQLDPLRTTDRAHVVEPIETPAWIWIERGWIPHTDGVPPDRTPGPHGSLRYTATDSLTFHPAHTFQLDAGWNAIGFPGLAAPADPGRLLGHLPLEVAWGWAPEERSFQAYVPGQPGVSTLDKIDPGQGLIVRVDEDAKLDIAQPTTAPQAHHDELRLSALEGDRLRDGEAWTALGPSGEPASEPIPAQRSAQTDITIVWTGSAGSSDIPDPPPAIVHGTIRQGGAPVRGTPVELVADGQILERTETDPSGSFEIRTHAGEGSVRLPEVEGSLRLHEVGLESGSIETLSLDAPSPRELRSNGHSPVMGILLAAAIGAAFVTLWLTAHLGGPNRGIPRRDDRE